MNESSIVIGGGIAGCATAYALAQRGIAVTIIERHSRLAQEASGNPVAMLYPKLSATESIANQITSLGYHFTLSLLHSLPQMLFISMPIFSPEAINVVTCILNN